MRERLDTRLVQIVGEGVGGEKRKNNNKISTTSSSSIGAGIQ